jgi:hypothetical protein
MDKIRKIVEVEEGVYVDVNKYLRRGWILLEVKKEREIETDGAFKDKVIYVLGHENPDERD